MSGGGKYRFRLFVVGDSPAGKRARHNFQKLREQLFEDEVELELEVVDILQHPERAEKDRIVAAPALMRVAPLPVFKIVGDLTSSAHLRGFFGLDADGNVEREERRQHVQGQGTQ